MHDRFEKVGASFDAVDHRFAAVDKRLELPVDSLNWRTRCGCRPWARQMRCTEETLIPAVLAIMPAVQWVVSPGGSSWVLIPAMSLGHSEIMSLAVPT